MIEIPSDKQSKIPLDSRAWDINIPGLVTVFKKLFIEAPIRLGCSFLFGHDGSKWCPVAVDQQGRLNVLTTPTTYYQGDCYTGNAADAGIVVPMVHMANEILICGYDHPFRMEFGMGVLGPWYGQYLIDPGEIFGFGVRASHLRFTNEAAGNVGRYKIFTIAG